MQKNNPAQTDFVLTAQQRLHEALDFLRGEADKAETYRGTARVFWREAKELVLAAIAFIDQRTTRADVLVSSAAQLEQLDDAIYRTHLGFEVYKAQFARVQWLVSAAEDLRDRLVQRGLLRGNISSVVPIEATCLEDFWSLLNTPVAWATNDNDVSGRAKEINWDRLLKGPPITYPDVVKASADAEVFSSPSCTMCLW